MEKLIVSHVHLHPYQFLLIKFGPDFNRCLNSKQVFVITNLALGEPSLLLEKDGFIHGNRLYIITNLALGEPSLLLEKAGCVHGNRLYGDAVYCLYNCS